MKTPAWPNLQRTNPSLRVAPDRRWLQYDDGAAFLYLGDTAWELLHRLSLDEARHYLADRSAKGFTVIQTVVLGELEGLTAPNANGDRPLIANDPARPNEAYFRHVDAIVAEAGRRGLVMGLLPTWGKYFIPGHKECIFTPDNAGPYGEFLGRRYRDAAVIWILGGDTNAANETMVRTVEALSAGLRLGDGGRHLQTYHPCGPGRSSDVFHGADWLDFNMVQSSHAGHGFDNGLFMERDRALTPPKPTLDGEPRYESIPTGFYFQGQHPADRFTDVDARQAAWWSLLAGACGHTYGNNNIWQMWQPGRKSILGANVPWYEALQHPGARQMTHARRLMESRPFQRLEPAQDLLLDAPRAGPAKARAARADDGSFALVYTPQGEPVTVDMAQLTGLQIRQSWYDPRYGTAYPLHTGVKGILTFTPPTRGPGCDWVLVLDDTAAGYAAPGDWPTPD